MFRIPTLTTLGFGEGARVPAVEPPLALDVVPLFAEHAREVARIDREIQPHPWSEAKFQRAKPCHGRFGSVALVAGTDRVAGYAVSALDVEASTLRILQFGTAPGFRRKRVATRIFYRLIDDSEDDGVGTIEVPVPEQMSGPRKFLTSLGFRGSHVLRDYYGSEDAWVFKRRVNPDRCLGK